MAGAALIVDYILTVAVSVTAGVAALIAAFPTLAVDRVWLCVFAIAFITYVNLRGVRESARVFALPTYLFITMVLAIVAVGIFHHHLERCPGVPSADRRRPFGCAAGRFSSGHGVSPPTSATRTGSTSLPMPGNGSGPIWP
jgi:amino acid transporter